MTKYPVLTACFLIVFGQLTMMLLAASLYAYGFNDKEVALCVGLLVTGGWFGYYYRVVLDRIEKTQDKR